MPNKKSGPSKSEFVRSQPVELSVAEVVAKAKEAGITITPGHVSNIRSLARNKDKKAKKSAANTPHAPAAQEAKPKAAKKSAGGKPTASDFIRSLPFTMSIKEVREKAAAAGYSFSSALVNMARSRMKSGTAAAGNAKAAPKDAPAAAKSAGSKLSASAFILAQPVSMSAADIARKAASEGYSFKATYVHNVRSAAKKQQASNQRQGAQDAKVKSASAAGYASLAAQFRSFIVRLGLDRVEALYAEVHRELKAIEG
jgi:hypothetical protein